MGNNGNVMGEVRESLLDTLRQLKDKKLKPDEAKAVASVAQTLINSYTLQVRAINALGGNLPPQFVQELTGLPPSVPAPALPPAKRLEGKPSAGPNEGIHAADPLRTVKPLRAAK